MQIKMDLFKNGIKISKVKIKIYLNLYYFFIYSCSYLDKDNGKWFGTEFGIQHIDKDGNRKNYNTATTPLILSNLISCINQDNQGKLWFGTSDGGISVFNGTSWQNYNKQNSNLATNNIGRIKFDKNGNEIKI